MKMYFVRKRKSEENVTTRIDVELDRKRGKLSERERNSEMENVNDSSGF